MFPTHFVFNHFPKAGGTSFLAVCKYNIPATEISPQLMEQDLRLARLERFEHYRLIRGHFGVLTQMGFSRDRYSFTLLRNPISTILSTYNFWRSRPEEDAVTSQAKHMSFAEFVHRFAKSPAVINNTFTHHFAAVSREYPGEPDPQLLLEVAKHNLAAFNFVGICEQFDETVRQLCHEIGWQVPSVIPHENRSGREQSKGDIEPEIMQVLIENNQLDLQLYDYARALFRARYTRSAEPHIKTTLPPHANGPEGVSAPNRFVAFPIPRIPGRVAQILSVSTQPGAAGCLEKIVISYRVEERIPELIAGILILDGEGNVISGTNTMIEKLELPHEPGQEQSVTFKLSSRLAPGTYSISAALARSDRPGFHYDWLDRATVFQVHPIPIVESRVKTLMTQLAKATFRPISQRVYTRIDTRLQLHLQPIEGKLGLLEAASGGVRDRIAGLQDAITALRSEQNELRKEIKQLSHPAASEVR